MKVNFDELEYNLYELLDVPEDASLEQIKSSYKKLVIKYHPDKNPDQDFTDLFSNVSIAYRVLKKTETRKKYDNYLTNKKNTLNLSHLNLKSNYQNNNKKEVTESDIRNAKMGFHSKVNELNKKHSYTEDFSVLNSNQAQQRLNLLQERRKNLNIDHVPIFKNSKFTNETFNQKFDAFKNGDNTLNIHNQEIIKAESNLVPAAYHPSDNSLTQYTPFTEASYNDLYVEDSNIQSNNFTSLDIAFSLKDSSYQFDNKSIEERLKNREMEDDNFKSMNIEDFSNETYDYGIHDKLK